MPEAINPVMYLADNDRPGNHIETSQEQAQDRPARNTNGLTVRESVELFQEAVDAAREDYQKLNSEANDEALKPKLTVAIRNRDLTHLPKEVVAIIKQDVERLQLCHNGLSHIAYEFTQCAALKYLNLRDNNFKEIPKAIFGLPQLEILDFSRNKLSEVPDEIGSLTSLRVFCLQFNNIQDLPYTLLRISTLRMLKVSGNPLNRDLQHVISGGRNSLSPLPSLRDENENERDTLLTREILNHMRNNTAPRDSGEESTDDGPLETPRALSRFPVQPQYGHSTSGSESASDLRSPIFTKPALPTRSHTRGPSNQYNALHNAAARRPGLTPLALGNERNRSNSESILNSSQLNRTKRQGLIAKKASVLGVLDDSRANRNSYHSRGQSHGSALRNGVRAGDSSPSGSQSSGEIQRGKIVRRLASLPEQKQDLHSAEPIIASAKGVLYSVDLIHPMASDLASVVKDGKTKRLSIERDFHSAIMRIEYLDQELLRMESLSRGDDIPKRQHSRVIAQATHDCIVAHQRIWTLLTQVARHLVKHCDQRHVRTLMLTIYGSTNELINASKIFNLSAAGKSLPNRNIQRVSTISEVPSEGEYTYKSDRSMTPTQRRKPERRMKPGNQPQQSISYTNLTAIGVQTAVPLYANGRSRSNSRAGAFHHSASSSIVNTPRSGESFSSANLIARSRSGSINTTAEQIRAEKKETAQFEEIFSLLRRSVEEGQGFVTHLQMEFLHALDAADKHYVNTKVRDQWAILSESTIHCLELTVALKMSLSNVRLNDREARSRGDFWRLARSFVGSYSSLLLSVKEGIKANLVDPSLRHQLKPLFLFTKEITTLIRASPWDHLTFDADPQATPQAIPQVQTQISTQNVYQHRTRGSGESTAGGTSPYPSNVPATPLSAALGPAAQATVPAPPPTPAGTIPPTPGTASLERSFEGTFFQRADTYQQTMVPRRQGP